MNYYNHYNINEFSSIVGIIKESLNNSINLIESICIITARVTSAVVVVVVVVPDLFILMSWIFYGWEIPVKSSRFRWPILVTKRPDPALLPSTRIRDHKKRSWQQLLAAGGSKSDSSGADLRIHWRRLPESNWKDCVPDEEDRTDPAFYIYITTTASTAAAAAAATTTTKNDDEIRLILPLSRAECRGNQTGLAAFIFQTLTRFYY